MRVTVVIAARNAERVLGEQLSALLPQLGPSVQALVVDDASEDGTAGIVLAQPSQYVSLVQLSKRSGTSAAKNAGAAASRGDVLLFCDADDVVDAAWVHRMCEALVEEPICGSQSSFVRLNTAEQRIWYGRSEGLYGLRFCGGRIQYATGAGLGIQRQVFDRLGGFDTDFVLAHDDVDLCRRAQRAGVDIVVAEGAIVHRRLRTTGWALARQQYHYAKSHKQFVDAHRLGSTGVLHDAWFRVLTTSALLLRSSADRRRWLKTAAWALGLS